MRRLDADGPRWRGLRPGPEGLVAPLLLAAVLAVLVPVGLHAQDGTGQLAGEVVTESGLYVAGASVEVRAVGGALIRRQLSGQNGRFLFLRLPAGTYQVRIEQPGYRLAERTDIRVEAGALMRIEVALEPAPLELEEVEVVVSPVSISRTETEYTTRLNETAIELLPVGYDADDLITQTPGARPGHVWGGATEQANTYHLDGLAANHPGVGGGLIEPSIAWIETIEIRGLGTGAEHGNFQGGLIDITTKTGSNRVRGALRSRAEADPLSSSNLGGHEIGSELSGRYDVEGELRGPLVRDRLFYFVSGQWLQADSRHLNHLRQYEGRFLPAEEERSEGKWFGKLTWRPTSRDRIDLTAGGMHLTVDHHGQTGYEAPDASWRLTAPTTFYGVHLQHNPGPWGLFEARVATFARDEERVPYAGDAVPGIQHYGIRPPFAGFQNAPLRFRHAPESISGTVSARFNLNTWGVEHLLKFGAELSRGSFVDERLRTGGLTWRPPRLPRFDPDDPSTWVFSSLRFVPSTWGGEVRLHADVENGALYVQDYMTLSRRLVLTPGLRYGRWRGWLIPTGGGERFLAVEDGALEPRMGATLDLTGDNSLVVKAHWGRYHQNMLAQMFDRTAGGNVFTNEQLWYYRGELFDDPHTTFSEAERDRLAERGAFTLEEEIVLNETGPVADYRQPYVDQWVVGLEKTIGDKVKLEAVYVNRRNRQMVALVDRNRESNYTAYDLVRVLDASGQPLQYNGMPLFLKQLYLPNDVLIDRLRRIAAGRCDGCLLPPGLSLADTARLSYDPDYVLTNVPDARREFDQLQLSLRTSFRSWGATASVVFTRLRGNLDTVTGYDDPAGFGAGPYVRVNEGVNAFGYLDNFADRELKASVYGQLGWGLRGGVFWQYALGDHYSPRFTLSGLQYRYATLDGQEIDYRFVLPLAGHNVFVGRRGSRQYPIRATVDARLERSFELGRGVWVMTLEGYNLFNAESVVDHNTSVNRGKNYYYFLNPDTGAFRGTDPNEYFQAVRERVKPRSLRIGLAYRF